MAKRKIYSWFRDTIGFDEVENTYRLVMEKYGIKIGHKADQITADMFKGEAFRAGFDGVSDSSIRKIRCEIGLVNYRRNIEPIEAVETSERGSNDLFGSANVITPPPDVSAVDLSALIGRVEKLENAVERLQSIVHEPAEVTG